VLPAGTTTVGQAKTSGFAGIFASLASFPTRVAKLSLPVAHSVAAPMAKPEVAICRRNSLLGRRGSFSGQALEWGGSVGGEFALQCVPRVRRATRLRSFHLLIFLELGQVATDGTVGHREPPCDLGARQRSLDP
jgi:hypothetical protein